MRFVICGAALAAALYVGHARAAHDAGNQLADSFGARFDAVVSPPTAEMHAAYFVVLPPPKPSEADIVPAGRMLVGAASMYDPTDASDRDSGTEALASGERYDPYAWTAAIRTDLRDQFGGVRFGRNYRPTYALVESGDKRLIVRINDIGPLKAGRVIDLNRRAMQYFDPMLKRGIVNVRVTALEGQTVIAGPLDLLSPTISVAMRFER
jgi:rare lipoprotein A